MKFYSRSHLHNTLKKKLFLINTFFIIKTLILYLWLKIERLSIIYLRRTLWWFNYSFNSENGVENNLNFLKEIICLLKPFCLKVDFWSILGVAAWWIHQIWKYVISYILKIVVSLKILYKEIKRKMAYAFFNFQMYNKSCKIK